MSIKVMTWVWEQDIQQGPKFLLLAIADHAGDEDWSAWPSVGRLAKKVNASESTVRRQIAKLAADGWLRVEKNAGPGPDGRRPNLYTILRDSGQRQVMEGWQSDTPPEDEGSQSDTPQVRPGDTSGVRSPDTQTISEPSGNPHSGGKAAALTVGQRANAIARGFCDKHPLHSFHGIRAIVTRAIQAGHADQRIADVLATLADGGKPVTVGTIRWELEGPPRFERQPHTVDDPGTRVNDNGLEVLGAPVMDPRPPNEAFMAARRQTKGVRHE